MVDTELMQELFEVGDRHRLQLGAGGQEQLLGTPSEVREMLGVTRSRRAIGMVHYVTPPPSGRSPGTVGSSRATATKIRRSS